MKTQTVTREQVVALAAIVTGSATSILPSGELPLPGEVPGPGVADPVTMAVISLDRPSQRIQALTEVAANSDGLEVSKDMTDTVTEVGVMQHVAYVLHHRALTS